MRCLSRTDLPPPLRPMMTVIDPVGTSSERPRSTGCGTNDFTSDSTWIIVRCSSRQDRDHEVVADEDQYRGEDERLSRSARSDLGAEDDDQHLVCAGLRHHVTSSVRCTDT